MSYDPPTEGAKVICAECGRDRERDGDQQSGGAIHYKRCAHCGAIGIRWNTDTGLRHGKVLEAPETPRTSP